VMCWYIDRAGQPFKIVDNRAAYIGRMDELPRSYERASAEQRALFDEHNQLVWELVIENMGLIHYMARKFPHKPGVADEVGLDTLLRAAAGWDPDKGKFSTYACTALYRAYVRHRPMLTCEPFEESVEQTFELDTEEELQYILNSLDEHDRCLLQLRYIHQLELNDIGEAMGLVKSTVHYHVTQALRRARDVWSASRGT